MKTAKHTAHTPTPWEAYSYSIKSNVYKVKRGREEIVAHICQCTNCDDINGYANARHIVKCVNMHDALVEALWTAQEFINSIENFNDEAREALDEINEALKQDERTKHDNSTDI